VQVPYQRWMHWFAALTAVSTLGLIGLGGLVTSHGVGLAVPDWPTTYGYNMFLFPVSYWIGGIFYEHTHRLAASLVGLLTTILAVWLWLREPRAWVRWLGLAVFLLVLLQGLLGGLRVTMLKAELGIFHATLAQIFLVLTSALALFTSRWWIIRKEREEVQVNWGWGRALVVAGSALIFLQLMLGATMRHQHAGLAVPDFPLAYGKVWPPTDPQFLERVNRERLDYREYNNVTAFQIYLHMGHRVMAVAILILTGWAAFKLFGMRQRVPQAAWFGLAWFGTILVQAGLGVATVLSGKAADIATLHVVMGAASLVLGVGLGLGMYPAPEKWQWFSRAVSGASDEKALSGGKPVGTVI
jgi:heme a synthase